MNLIQLLPVGKPPLPVIAPVAVFLVLLLFTSTRSPAAESSAVTLDPVITEVIEMLAADVDEAVIAQWMKSTGRRPADIGSGGIIALTEAGASDQLINSLLRRFEEGSATERLEFEPGDPAPEDPIGEGMETSIQLRAKQVWVDEDEPDRPREPSWDVYLYLDGEFVAWARPTLQGAPVEGQRILQVGSHEMRVVLQRYEEMRGGWLYESLAVPTLIGFDAGAGDPIEIEVEMKRIWGLWRQRQDGGPLSYVIRQGGRVLAEHPGTGGDPDRWSPICEDVEANFVDSDEIPKRFRNPMSRCVRWAEMWSDLRETTDRSAILKKLAESDFQPPVR